MKIAINFQVLKTYEPQEKIIELLKKLKNNKNKIYIFVNSDEYFTDSENYKKNTLMRKQVIEYLKEVGVEYTDVICIDSFNTRRIQNILNIGALIEKNDFSIRNLNDNIEVFSFRDDSEYIEDRRIYCDSTEEVENLITKLISKKEKDLKKFEENDSGLPSIDCRWKSSFSIDQINAAIPKMNIHDCVYYSNYSNLNSLAIRYFGKEFTFDDFFNNKVNEFARSLKKFGIKEGDIVTIMMPTTPEGLIAFFAINKIGAVACMLHPLLKCEDIKDTLEKTQSRYLIMSDMCYSEFSKIEEQTSVERVVVASPANSMPVLKGTPNGIKGLYIAQEKIKELKKQCARLKLYLARFIIPKSYKNIISELTNQIEALTLELKKIPYGEKYIRWNDEIKNGADYVEKIESVYHPNSLALLLRTGGTSGHAKLAALTNENVTSNTSQLRDSIPPYEKGNEMLSVLPIFHGFGLVDSIISPLAFNMSVDLHPQYKKSIFAKAVLKNKPFLILGVPTLWKSVIKIKKFNGKDLSFAKVWISGGDTLVKNLKKNIDDWRAEHNAEYPILSGIGMTEATAAIALTTLNSKVEGSVGYPLPMNEIKIINPETQEEVGYEQPGELCISGPSVMLEYYENPEETKKALRVEDGKIWLHTGDICMIHKNGELTYEERNENIIIVSGVNVYSNKIEEFLMRIPEIESCAVVAMPHPYKMNVPVAYITLKEGIFLDDNLKRKILSICEDKLDTYSKVVDVIQLDSLPLTALNKVNKKKLKQDIEDRISRDAEKQKVISLKK